MPNPPQWRALSPSEQGLLRALLRRGSPLALPANWLNEALVAPLNDSGMGSLRFKSDGVVGEDRRFGSQHATIEFRDLDGVVVSAALQLDEHGQPFELDVWKTDLRPLVAIPSFPD